MAPPEDSAPVARLTGDRYRWQGAANWFLSVLLVLDLGILLVVLSLANVTAEGPAKRGLRQSVAILTEVDAFLDDHLETLRQEATQTRGQDLTLPDFPVQVAFTPEEIRSADRDEFRSLVLSRSADRIYEEGMSVFQEDRGSEMSFFSPQGVVRSAMDFLRPTPHRLLTALTIALAAVAAVLAMGLVLVGRGYGRLLALGLSVLAASAPFLIVAVALRFAFRLAADGLDDYLAREFLQLSQELTWSPIRNGIVFSVGGAVVCVAGAAVARWSDSRRSL